MQTTQTEKIGYDQDRLTYTYMEVVGLVSMSFPFAHYLFLTHLEMSKQDSLLASKEQGDALFHPTDHSYMSSSCQKFPRIPYIVARVIKRAWLTSLNGFKGGKKPKSNAI